MLGSRALAPAVLAVLAAAALAGCGSSSSAPSSSHTSSGGASGGSSGGVLVTPGQKQSRSAGVKAVAYVSGTPIALSTYRHWVTVERESGATSDASHRALAFLITSSWVLGEAQARHIDVSRAEAKRRLEALEHRSFPKHGQLQRFLSKTHQSEADLLARERVEMLSSRISEQVAGKASGRRRSAALASFQSSFEAHWRRLTSCRPRYVMEDCRQYEGSGEPELSQAPSSKSTGSGAGSGTGSGAGSSGSGEGAATGPGSGSSASTSGEVPSHPGAFTLESPAFARNGAIPAKYTCDGAGVSPPLRWSNVPKHASELVLFVIDDSSSGRSGGIRWVLGGIDPSTTGIAAGQTPPGAVVGTNSSGGASYGAICPAAGHTDTIELVMYALRKKIALSPGFQPSTAEQEYGSTKDLLGEAAVTYAVYHRP